MHRKMTNRNYKRGYNFENYCQNVYQDKGYHVTRSAGSHGMADLIIVSPQGSFYFAQCKRTKKQLKEFTKKQKEEFYNYCIYFKALPLVLIKMRKSKKYIDGFYCDYLDEIRRERQIVI